MVKYIKHKNKKNKQKNIMQKNIVIIIVAVLISLGIGFYIGTVSSPIVTKTATVIQKDVKLQATVKALSSKLVVSSIVQGNVTKISGKILTLSDGTDTINISVGDTAQIYSFAPPTTAGKPAAPTKINFSALKVGDQLNVNIQVSASGDVQGISVLLIPPVK
jgi:hypothetical protein